MKLLVFQIVFLLIGLVLSTGSDSHDLWKHVLLKFNIDIDTKLITLFPNMEGIAQIQSMDHPELNDCYNMEIGNETFNIFTDSIYTIVHHYFVYLILLIVLNTIVIVLNFRKHIRQQSLA